MYQTGNIIERTSKDLIEGNPVYKEVYVDGDLHAVILAAGRHQLKADGAGARLAKILIENIVPRVLQQAPKIKVINMPDMSKIVRAVALALRNDPDFKSLARKYDPNAKNPRPTVFARIMDEGTESDKEALVNAICKYANQVGIVDCNALREYIMTKDKEALRRAVGERKIEQRFYEDVTPVEKAVIATILNNIYKESLAGRRLRGGGVKTGEQVVKEILERVAYTLSSGAAAVSAAIFDSTKVSIASRRTVYKHEKVRVKHGRVFKYVNAKLVKDLGKEAAKLEARYMVGGKPLLDSEALMKALEPHIEEIVKLAEEMKKKGPSRKAEVAEVVSF